MALRALLLRSRIDTVVTNIAALRAQDDDFARREAEMTQAISEMFVIRKSLSMKVIHFVSGEMMRNASSTPRTTKKTRSGFLSAP